MKAQDIFNGIVKNDEEGSQRAFEQTVKDKLNVALEVRKVGLTAEIFNKTLVNESTQLEEAKLVKPKGSPLEVQNQLGELIAQAKKMKGVSDDEYMSWYSNLDDKTFDKWFKMVKADPQYKKAYKLGTQGGSDKSPFPKGTFAAVIWFDEYAAGAIDT